MSFNRPDLLGEVLKSLENQTVEIDGSQVYLFQDGPLSKLTQTEPDDLVQNECVKRFLDVFPDGNVFRSPVNIGVALNFDRAERLFFESLKADCGLFFEDDLVLSPHYLDALLQLANFALNEPLVSYVAAYGNHTTPLERQRTSCTKIIPMIHNWGFAITRRQWLQQKEIVDGYLSIVRENDYRARDHNRIRNYFTSLGFAWGGSSQDSVKGLASLVLGTTRLMCFPCFGHYIGRSGLHFTSDIYVQCGYDKTILFDQPPPLFDMPARAELVSLVNDERAISRLQMKEIGNANLSGISIHTSADAFVRSLYFSLLERPPDQAGLATWTNALKNGKTRSDLITAFVNSREYKSKHLVR